MKQPRILIVDDDLSLDIEQPFGDMMWYYVDALRDAGFALEGATGCDQALDMLSKDRSYDVIVLDIIMSSGKIFHDVDTRQGLRTGVRIAEALNKEYAAIPVIVFTNLPAAVLTKEMTCSNVKMILEKKTCTPYALARHLKTFLGLPNEPAVSSSGNL